MKNALKSIVIAALAVLTFYQTSRLWFEDRSISDIFLSFNLTNEFRPSDDELEMLRTPSRLLISVGERRFASKMNQLAGSEIVAIVKELTIELLKNGEPGEAKPFDANAVFADGAVVLVYEYGIPADVYTQALNSKSSLLSSRIDTFKYLAVLPAVSDSGVSMIFASDTQMYGFLLPVRADSLIALIKAEEGKPPLVYELDAGGEFFEGYALVPKWMGAFYEYRNVSVSNPFAVDESVTRNTFESRGSIYFDNQSSLWLDNPNDVYTLSDESTIVKYYSNGLLEYASYKSAKSRVANNFLSAFSAAYQIITNDPTIRNELRLASYSYDGETWHFGFDIALNDLPFLFSKDLQQELELEHFIEISVSGDVVTKFRRFIAAYETDESFYSRAYVQFDELIETMFIKGDEAGGSRIKELRLGYRIERSKQLSPYWEIYISDVPAPLVMPLD